MGERHYTIAEIAKKVNVEPHLLRYWEDELALDIPRNERGLRYYRRQELMLFRAIQNLRTKGFRMGAIKMVLQDIYRVEDLPAEKLLELRDRIDDAMGLKKLDATFEDGHERVPLKSVGETTPSTEVTTEAGTQVVHKGAETVPATEKDKAALKLEQFRKLMTEIVYDAMKNNNEELSRRINYTVSDSVVREMDHLMRKREEREEVHFRKIDQALAGFRKEMGEVAVTTAPELPAECKKERKTFSLFKKRDDV